MASSSFEIIDSRGFYNKLLEDYEAFLTDTSSSRLAVNCTMTAWHLGEWIFWEFRSSHFSSFRKVEDYTLHLRTVVEPDLDIMRCITNGSKHFGPPNGVAPITSTEIHDGPFSNVFSNQFDQTYLYVILNEGSEVRFEEILEKVMAFWKSYLTTTFGWSL